MDAQVGRLLDALDELNLTDSTLVLFVSDHGYHLGQHGLWQKGDLFEGSARVPLLIAGPGVRGDRDSSAIVEMVDIYPTIAEFCELPLPDHLKGRSLMGILLGRNEKGKEAALTVSWSRAHRMHPEFAGKQIMGNSVRTARYRYTEWSGGEYGVELYDYENDPGEITNLAKDPAHAKTVERLKVILEKARSNAE
jgi:arylsulfatase A-like enzyme